jgi:protein ImuB
MPLAEAQTLTRQPTHFETHDPAADVDALRQLAVACQRFAPLVSVEDADLPDSLLLDVTGCVTHFGDEWVLVHQVLRQFQRYGLSVRVALAPSFGAAWAAAHFAEWIPGSQVVPDGKTASPNRTARPAARTSRTDSPAFAPPAVAVLAPEQLRAALRGLPVSALRIPDNTIATLQQVGITRIGQLMSLPRQSLPSRFGRVVLERLDQACGDVTEVLIVEKLPDPIVAQWSFEEPLADRHSLGIALRRMLDSVVEQLQRRQVATQRLLCRLDVPPRPPWQFTVGLVRPTSSAAYLGELVRLQLENVSLAEAVTAVRVEAIPVSCSLPRQQDLFGSDASRDRSQELHVLIERLSNRLGPQAVLRPVLVPDAQPEFAVQFEPWLSDGDDWSQLAHGSTPPLIGPGLRPLRLLAQPLTVDVVSIIPAGPPVRFRWDRQHHAVARSWGPERIETGWWREPPASRDYFRVETNVGCRFWLFHTLDTSQWFLHGVFD